MSLGSMHSGWMIIASSEHGKLFVGVLVRNRMLHVWQSRIEIEYYSIVYFDVECITEFDTL